MTVRHLVVRHLVDQVVAPVLEGRSSGLLEEREHRAGAAYNSSDVGVQRAHALEELLLPVNHGEQKTTTLCISKERKGKSDTTGLLIWSIMTATPTTASLA